MVALPPDIEWHVSDAPIDYADALSEMETRAAAVCGGGARERLWLLEHPPIYTAGTSAIADELLDPRFPVVATGRGGRYTYHGPGQRVGYLVLDLAKRGRDVRCFVHAVEGWVIDLDRRGRDVRCYVHSLEDWAIAALARLGVAAWRAEGRVGIWTDDQGREAKIGAIGVRVKRWVTLHGMAINADPDLSHFGGIVPCGLPDYPVTSLAALGTGATMVDLDAALAATAGDFVASLSGECKKP